MTKIISGIPDIKFQMSERIRRFDDIFKLLLIVSTIIFSAALAFYKEYMPGYFFSGYILSEIFAIILWSVGHTRKNFVHEAFYKLFSWFMLIFFTSGNIWSLAYQIPRLMKEPFITKCFLLTISYCFTLPIYFYFESTLPQKTGRILIIFVILAGIVLSYSELRNFIQSVFL